MNLNDAIASISAMIDANDLDTIELIDALCDAFELCRMHHCDYRICLDDANPECAELNN